MGLARRVAAARLSEVPDEVAGLLEEAVYDEDRGVRSVAIGELCLEVAVAVGEARWARCRMLVRAVRRYVAPEAELAAELGDPRPGGLDALAAAVRAGAGLAAAPAELVLLRSDLRELARSLLDVSADAARAAGAVAPAPVRAAALRLLGVVADPSDTADTRRLADGLGDRDEEMRRAATAALRHLGEAALEPLLVAASYGRRPARNGALELLRDLPVTPGLLDGSIDAELRELDETCLRLAPLAAGVSAADAVASPPAADAERADPERASRLLLARRLIERIDEIAHTLFLLLEARYAEPTIGTAARLLLRAPDRAARARALEAVDTVLPRGLAGRVVTALDDAPFAERSARAAARLGRAEPSADDAVRAELACGDALSRPLLVHALGAAGRHSHRGAIAAAAHAAARSLDPMSLLRRIAAADGDAALDLGDDGPGARADDVPSSVDTLLALGRIPLFAELTTRQLTELASVVRWQTAAPGDTVVAQGAPADAMYLVVSGRVRVEVADGTTTRTVAELGPGEPFGEMALLLGEERSASVIATERTRLARIGRADFEELVEDTPGIALAICRVLTRRVRSELF